jgi:hypothetical protein
MYEVRAKPGLDGRHSVAAPSVATTCFEQGAATECRPYKKHPQSSLTDWAGADVVIDAGLGAIWSTTLLCELLQDFGERFQVEWLREV